MDSLSHLPQASQLVRDIDRLCYLIAVRCGGERIAASLRSCLVGAVEDVDLRAEMLRRGWDDEQQD